MQKQNILLSVIVPVYNAEKTLPRCLESILRHRDIELEVICVDDESTDNSLKLCRRFAQDDSRITVVCKSNGGVASARNKGLEIAGGKYVTFVDQDDWVEEGMYSKLIGKALREDADMIVCNYTKDFKEQIQKITNAETIAASCESPDMLIRYAFFREKYRGFAAFVWNKIFKRSFLEKNNIWFDGTLRRGDDVLFFSMVASNGPRTFYVDENMYHYVQREDSITHTLTKDNIARLAEILTGYERAIFFLEKSKISSNAVAYMKCFYVYHASRLFELADKYNLLSEKQKYRNAMELYLSEYKEQNSNDEERITRINRLLEV